MRIQNRMTRLNHKLQSLPEAWRPRVQTAVMGRMVPFLKTAGLRFDRLSQEEVAVSIRSRRAVHNHIGGVHACAMALLAETATGFATIMNTPDDKLILLKSMHIDYTRRSVGSMRAVATLDSAAAERIANEERGNFSVPCRVYDDSGEEPVTVDMVWAWLPRQQSQQEEVAA
ncbi:uncharacterized protein (TIGR00369 family) [Neisseria sp. HSC-16F19]|nr:DUF4442 domain-containing protein [Neisseria sp. HSC-16F19]MCP2039682.1 uncharacterized protein (TIGR00369 family) [Neisseria sp. HSC-16F19]